MQNNNPTQENLSKAEIEEFFNQVREKCGSFLHYAVTKGDIRLIQFELSNPDFLNSELLTENENGFTPWHMAVLQGNLEVLNLLYSYYKNQVDIFTSLKKQTNQTHVTALYLSMLDKNFETFKWLINKGANINAMFSPTNFSPLTLSIGCHFPPAVKYLLEEGTILDQDMTEEIKDDFSKGKVSQEEKAPLDEIFAMLDYFLELRNKESYTLAMQIDYAQKFWNKKCFAKLTGEQPLEEKNNNITENKYPMVPANNLSLKQLIIVKICFFQNHQSKSMDLKKLPIELQEEYQNFAKTWLNNTTSSSRLLLDHYYSTIKDKLTEILEKDTQHSVSTDLGQYVEIIFCQAGNLLKEINAIYKDKKIEPKQKIEYFLQAIIEVSNYLYRKGTKEIFIIENLPDALRWIKPYEDKNTLTWKLNTLIIFMNEMIDNKDLAPEIHSTNSNCQVM